jgi:Arc/MetJ-type ribon-helix-helix transcriptional regulator
MCCGLPTASTERPLGSMSLNVSLLPELKNRVRAHVASEMLGSASEGIRHASRLFDSYQSVQGATLANLKNEIEQGQAHKQARQVAPLNIKDMKAEGRKRRTTKAVG